MPFASEYVIRHSSQTLRCMLFKKTNTEKLLLPYAWEVNLSLRPVPVVLRNQDCPSAVRSHHWSRGRGLAPHRSYTHLHSALWCRNELHWSGRFVSLDIDSRIEMICLNDGRFWRREKEPPWDLKETGGGSGATTDETTAGLPLSVYSHQITQV